MKITIACTRKEVRRGIWGMTLLLAIGIPALFVAQAVTVPHQFENGDIADADQVNENFRVLTDAVNALSDSGSGMTVSVDCNNPADQTLAGAVVGALPGTTLNITGTCVEMETVRITKDGLTLNGGGTTVLDGNGQGDVIRIDGARRVTIQGLVVRNGGEDGIEAARGAQVTLEDVTVEDNVSDGIVITSSAHANLQGEIVSSNNGDVGILIFLSSSVEALDSIIGIDTNGQAGPNGDGLLISDSSSLSFSGTTSITSSTNGRSGIFVSSNSSVHFFAQSQDIVENNELYGILIQNNSNVTFNTNTSITSSTNGRS